MKFTGTFFSMHINYDNCYLLQEVNVGIYMGNRYLPAPIAHLIEMSLMISFKHQPTRTKQNCR